VYDSSRTAEWIFINLFSGHLGILLLFMEWLFISVLWLCKPSISQESSHKTSDVSVVNCFLNLLKWYINASSLSSINKNQKHKVRDNLDIGNGMPCYDECGSHYLPHPLFQTSGLNLLGFSFGLNSEVDTEDMHSLSTCLA